ncbi:hypothetical protein [Desulfosporosinus hippei]|uniref:Uncharacterized protein n=1 Tax=Desulfosporosinus hippei DSM 8344 TaxID=1121419 RepID=A0A1G8CD24_9FIRM|nr:hypothetical protein [Desulfosporosinus hippei]SDH43315.1 hypothetical protein SAMN05443529_11365 [Desulfosporosinus hippei DSM 8344]
MKYIAKDKFDCEIEINDQILKVAPKLGPLQYDSNELSIIKHDVKLEKFSYAGAEDGLFKFSYKKDGKRKSIQVPFKYEQQKRICLVANAIVFSRYIPQDENPSFAIGLGGSLEIRSNRLLISRYSRFQQFPWARKLESKKIDFQSIKEVGFLKAGMIKESLVQEFSDVGCIRFVEKSKAQMQDIWNPLTDPNTILFDKSMEFLFYRLFVLIKKLTGIRTLEFEKSSSQYFSHSVHEYLEDLASKHQTENLICLTKGEQRKIKEEKDTMFYKLEDKGFLTGVEVKQLATNFQEKVKYIGMLYLMTDFKDKELDNIMKQYCRGLYSRDEFERFLMNYYRGYTIPVARELALKDYEIIYEDDFEEDFNEGESFEQIDYKQLNEAYNPRLTDIGHIKKGKVIQFPSRVTCQF